MSRRNVTIAINKLVRIREQIKALELQAKRCRYTIIAAGGGKTPRFIAQIVTLPAHSAWFDACEQVRIRQRPSKKS